MGDCSSRSGSTLADTTGGAVIGGRAQVVIGGGRAGRCEVPFFWTGGGRDRRSEFLGVGGDAVRGRDLEVRDGLRSRGHGGLINVMLAGLIC